MNKKKLSAVFLLLTALVILPGCSSIVDLILKEGPLDFTNLTMGFNSIETPEITVTVKNVSNTPIKAFRIRAYCENAYGNRIKAFGFGDTEYRGISQDIISPGESKTATWTLYGYDTAYEIEVTLFSTVDINDKTWTTTSGDTRYIRTVTKN